jgi:hypothetical protein
MKTAIAMALLLVLCSLPAIAGESGDTDHERPLVQQGVLGTVNVLRELDVKTWTNRVTATGNLDFSPDWFGGPADFTIDGSGRPYNPRMTSGISVITYTLPGLRTVSSVVICYEDAGNDAPDTVRLEGSADGGKTWFEVFKSKARKCEFLKCFKPAKVNALRLTQECAETNRHGIRTKEVFVYADPGAPPLPLFGSQDSGAFSFLRDLWYADKITMHKSLKNAVWTGHPYGKPFIPFASTIATAHDGAWGDAEEKGKRLYLRWNLDKAYPMNYGVISMATNGEVRCRLGLHPAEFYTANGNLDPSMLTGSSIKDLTGQGWILQNAWDKDPSFLKTFRLERPGKYNQMLLVWDAYVAYENDRWSHLEMFGSEAPDAGDTPKNPPNKETPAK